MSLDSTSIVPPKQREENYENCTKFFNRIWRFGRALETCSISLFKVVFRTAASFALLSPEACAILCLEASGNLLLESSDSTWVPPEGSVKPSRRLLPESSDSHVGTREGFIIYRLTCFSPFFAPPLEPPFCKTFPEIRVISAHIPLERHFPSQTKIPEKPGAKPLFGDFCCFIFCYSCI